MAETSFANAGVVGTGYVTPGPRPACPEGAAHDARQRAGARCAPASTWPCRGCGAGGAPAAPAVWQANHAHAAPGVFSRHRLLELTKALQLEYERARLLVLLRSESDLAADRAQASLTELGSRFHLWTPRCREPRAGAQPDMPLRRRHLPDDEVGNCRQFAHLLRHGAEAWARWSVPHRGAAPRAGRAAAGGGHAAGRIDAARHRAHLRRTTGPATDQRRSKRLSDASMRWWSAPGWAHGCAVAPAGPRCRSPRARLLGHRAAEPEAAADELGRRAAPLMDERSRWRSRVSASASVSPAAPRSAASRTTCDAAPSGPYKVLDDWFPVRRPSRASAALERRAPCCPTARRSSARAAEGLWLNLGHGSSGWALACGSTRLALALLMATAGRPSPRRPGGRLPPEPPPAADNARFGLTAPPGSHPARRPAAVRRRPRGASKTAALARHAGACFDAARRAPPWRAGYWRWRHVWIRIVGARATTAVTASMRRSAGTPARRSVILLGDRRPTCATRAMRAHDAGVQTGSDDRAASALGAPVDLAIDALLGLGAARGRGQPREAIACAALPIRC